MKPALYVFDLCWKLYDSFVLRAVPGAVVTHFRFYSQIIRQPFVGHHCPCIQQHRPVSLFYCRRQTWICANLAGPVKWTSGVQSCFVHSRACIFSIASNAMTLHTIFCCHFGAKILQARFLQVDSFDWEHSSFFRWSSETFFSKVHIFVTHLHKHFSRSFTKNCHRHVHRPPVTILHSTTNCAIGSQSFLLQISFLSNFEKMLLSKRQWTRCTLWTRFYEPLTRRKVRKKALKTFTQLRKSAQR